MRSSTLALISLGRLWPNRCTYSRYQLALYQCSHHHILYHTRRELVERRNQFTMSSKPSKRKYTAIAIVQMPMICKKDINIYSNLNTLLCFQRAVLLYLFIKGSEIIKISMATIIFFRRFTTSFDTWNLFCGKLHILRYRTIPTRRSCRNGKQTLCVVSYEGQFKWRAGWVIFWRVRKKIKSVTRSESSLTIAPPVCVKCISLSAVTPWRD